MDILDYTITNPAPIVRFGIHLRRGRIGLSATLKSSLITVAV